jgi:D-3-phosphoglycerate dehydrogenase
VELVDLESLLRESDFVTLHVPLTRETRHLLHAQRLALMKPTAYLINCARGEVVDEEALGEALREGRLAGAAIDVWSREPPFESPLLDLPQVVPTPHLGASTIEAQTKVAVDVAEQVVAVLHGGLPRTPVNLPAIPPETLERLQPYLRLAEKMGILLFQLSSGVVKQVEMHYYGEALRQDTQPITRAFLQGLLQSVLDIPINLVNAEHVARQRGIDVVEKTLAEESVYTNLVRTVVHTEGETFSVGGTVVGEGDYRIVYLDGFNVYLEPRGYVLLVYNYDQPGVVGRIGTILGHNGINIANMHLGRIRRGDRAVAVLNLDDPVPSEVLQEIESAPLVIAARLVDFGP